MDDKITKIKNIDIFKEGRLEENLVGHPFYLDYDKANVLVSDSKKNRVNGIPRGCFLLAFYEGLLGDPSEALLLRVVKNIKLPLDDEIIISRIEYYKDNVETTGKNSKLDDLTRFEFSFSGLECNILGSFYKDNNGKVVFGADVENFYSSNNYRVYKPVGDVLKYIVNCNLAESSNEENFEKIGNVRYSSSKKFQNSEDTSEVYISPKDFLGKRTALFGMTRTGKSNTVKKIVQLTQEINKYVKTCADEPKNGIYNADGIPNNPIGQIIFDINGEYANENLQDGTSISDIYTNDVIRYCVVPRDGFKVMKVNFYNEIEEGFELIKSHLREKENYITNFKTIDLSAPDEDAPWPEKVRYNRKIAAYKCCLYLAGLKPTKNNVKFKGHEDINEAIDWEKNTKQGVSLADAVQWFSLVWKNYEDILYIKEYPKSHDGREWADDDLKALLVFMTRCLAPKRGPSIAGYTKLREMSKLHTNLSDEPYDQEIINNLRKGKIVIADLSQGDPEIQKLFSERICEKIFADSMSNFTENEPNNIIQFYFEEAHNLFPKKEDSDLSQIYNRIAKEGAKLDLGLIYATQEVSSISSNILKNTQNWFIAHLNNTDETKELKKYYDFADFADSLVRFSPESDKGFVRMKTYSNSFVIPVQIDEFKDEGD
ncbi:hypothetical protein HNP93_001368 [Methanococcus maripaludis]|uniref:Helicase HerA central domain-containing protein n=1 Tax=Methanococcus maripaludis TaxID=39152 RepID=A0A7J9P7E4_METMI|nr:DUF87 domain-containing protein [Methanococcus maripaludis]MBA2858667.1 hypothetical protein [Methanococcus maripaludis]